MRWFVGLAVALVLSAPAWAYPEFEAWVEKSSGRYVDCAMCHSHPDGPEGVKPGQIRSLGPEELDRLNDARSAFEPGMGVDSPILNPFGDEIINRLGKTKFLEIRTSSPEQLMLPMAPTRTSTGTGFPMCRSMRRELCRWIRGTAIHGCSSRRISPENGSTC